MSLLLDANERAVISTGAPSGFVVGTKVSATVDVRYMPRCMPQEKLKKELSDNRESYSEAGRVGKGKHGNSEGCGMTTIPTATPSAIELD
jgi:phosphatidylserine decarboxylase